MNRINIVMITGKSSLTTLLSLLFAYSIAFVLRLVVEIKTLVLFVIVYLLLPVALSRQVMQPRKPGQTSRHRDHLDKQQSSN